CIESSGVSVRTRISMSPTGTNIRDNPTNKATAEHLVNIVSLFLIPYISPIIAHKGIPTGIIVRNQMSIL
ncbi:hypothetical protein, partial [Bacteroides ovatus]|uniref:hypothetical protein n=1 Tax=Bacteroides ovatus TaxID=28116 RepID=UPI00233ED25D